MGDKMENLSIMQQEYLEFWTRLIEKFRFEKLGEKAREIAQKDGRNIVTYADADEALKRIRAENKQ